MKRNTLTTAVLAGLTGMAGMVSVSNAVNVNPDGLGQVLLYPYYSARGDNATLISIVNTTTRGKAVKIRFIEALNSREVLDFNIYMSPFDVWTAGIVGTDEGGAKMMTSDRTCTVPYFVGGVDPGELAEQEFLTLLFDDGGPTEDERTASGYIEVIEMGTLLPTPNPEDGAPGIGDEAYIPWAVKHVAGEPRDCQHLVDQWTVNFPGGNLQWVSGDVNHGFDTDQGASGGLFGAGSIINVPEGTLLSYNATAVDGFWEQGTTFHTDPEDLEPDLSTGDEFVSNIFVNGQVVSHDWSTAENADTIGALNAVLTYSQVLNEFNTEADAGARTEWVMTFPTKRFHTDAAPGGFLTLGTQTAIAPFTNTWTVSNGTVDAACETFMFTTPASFEGYFATDGSRAFDREEGPDPVAPDDPTPIPPGVSPAPGDDDPDPGVRPVFNLCREANIVRFSSEDPDDLVEPDFTEILKEPWRDGDGLGYSNFNIPYADAGWVRFDLAEIGNPDPAAPIERRRSETGVNLNTGATEAVEGLPVVGFAANSFTNGELAGGVLSNYGGTFNHRGSRSVVPVVLDD
jgi:hypothetical protein